MEEQQPMLAKTFKRRIGEQEFTFTELTCLRRDTLMKIVGSFTFADIMASLLPILNELNISLGKDGEEKSEDDSIGSLIQLALQNEDLWGGLVLCLLNVMKIGPDVICLSLCEKDTVEKNEVYIKTYLTIRQEPEILEKIIEINELPQTIKNYRSLLAKVKNLSQMKNS